MPRTPPRRGIATRTGSTTEGDPTGLELVGKVDAVLTVLESRGEATAAEIAARTGEPLSSVYRLLQSLTGIGWVDRGWRRGSYRLGLDLLGIGSHLEDHLDLRAVALPALRRMLEVTGATSTLWVRRGTRVVCVERLEGDALGSRATQLGGSLPMFAGAPGRAILSVLPPAEQRSALASTRSPADPRRPEQAVIQAGVESARRAGYAVSDGEVTPGIAAVSAPVLNHRGELEAAISISGVRARIVADTRQRNIDLVVECAREVSRRLGHGEGS